MANKGKTLTARLLEYLLNNVNIIGESYTGDCDVGMTASTTTIVSDDLKGFGDDYFNTGWVIKVLHNVNSDGNPPEGEIRVITNYVSVDGTFTTAAFSANVEENDVVLVAKTEDFVISEYTLPVSPAAGSLASFISSGNGSAVLGTQLGIDVSHLDAIGHTGTTALTTGVYGNIGDFQAQINLQTLLAALGIPDILGKPLYTCLITDRLDNGTFGLAAIETELGLIPQSGGAVTWNGTALQSIQDEAEDALEGENLDHLQAVATAAADMTAEVVDGSVISRILSKTSDTSTYDPTTDAQEMLSDKLGAFTGDGGADQNDSTKASLDLLHTKSLTGKGITQIFEKSITNAANAGNVLIGTITDQPCLIKSVIVHADTAAQVDLTSAGVYGGTNIATHTVTFLSAAQAAKANIDAVDEQVAWTGAARLAATKVIAIELLGTGATAVDLTIIVEYMATADGGYIV